MGIVYITWKQSYMINVSLLILSLYVVEKVIQGKSYSAMNFYIHDKHDSASCYSVYCGACEYL